MAGAAPTNFKIIPIKRQSMGKRDCACVSQDAIECTMWRYQQDRETVIATQDWCECYCHDNDEDEDDYDYNI